VSARRKDISSLIKKFVLVRRKCVKDIFDNPLEVKRRRSRYEIYKRIDVSYYGYRDDEDTILEKVEQLMEEEM
jgi:hypothetical protein